MKDKVPGKVTIAPEVLVTIAQLTTQEIPGIYKMNPKWTRDVNRFFGDTRIGDGVQIQVQDQEIAVDLYVIVDQSASMLQLGRRIQREVTRAVEEMTGMAVKAVNVHIEDVYIPDTKKKQARGAENPVS